MLAARAGCDPRTAAKALKLGPTSVKGLAGDRCAAAMKDMGIGVPATGEVLEAR
jgi:hypothetical protein